MSRITPLNSASERTEQLEEARGISCARRTADADTLRICVFLSGADSRSSAGKTEPGAPLTLAPPRAAPQVMVADFKQRLDTNMGTFASGLWGRSRIRAAPKRPPQGWSLLVKPLGAGKGQEAFVALPDGTKARHFALRAPRSR